MSSILVTLHIIVCTALIMIVLLQTGKGSDMGAAFGGGGSQTLFGSTGASTFLSKATTVAAIVFMLTCLSLAYISGNKGGSSIMPDSAPPAPSAEEKPADAVPADAVPADAAPEETPRVNDAAPGENPESAENTGPGAMAEESGAEEKAASATAVSPETAPLSSDAEENADRTAAKADESKEETALTDTGKTE